jgi:hypothetical protein
MAIRPYALPNQAEPKSAVTSLQIEARSIRRDVKHDPTYRLVVGGLTMPP